MRKESGWAGAGTRGGGRLNVPDALSRALSLHARGRLAEAEALYRSLLEAEPAHCEAMHFLALALHQRGASDEAESCSRHAVELAPRDPDVRTTRGTVLLAAGRLDEAEGACRAALALAPEHPVALDRLGAVLTAQGRPDEAVLVLERAVRLRPESADAHERLADALRAAGRVAEAAEGYCRSIALDPRRAGCRRLLAYSLRRLGRNAEALRVVEEWLVAEPNDPVAAHLRAAFTGEGVPQRASDEFVRQTFDGYAASFDERLTGLGYRGPELVARTLEEWRPSPEGDLDVLDAGCGTGLCAPVLRPYARRLTAVDLSPKMLEKAGERGAYDALIAAELTGFLETAGPSYDLIVSADTLIYFGALERVLAAAAGALRPGGLFVFTLEQAPEGDGPDFVLQDHGRYAHSRAYASRCLEAAGLALREVRGAVVRQEAGTSVNGWIVSAERPDGLTPVHESGGAFLRSEQE